MDEQFDDQGNIIQVKKKSQAPTASAEGPHCKINRNSKAKSDMSKIVNILDGHGEKPKKAKGRSKKDELENILNTTLSIKTFAQVDEDKQRKQEENIQRIKQATFQVDINSQDQDDADIQFISITKYSNLIQNDLKSMVNKMTSVAGTEDNVSQKADQPVQEEDQNQEQEEDIQENEENQEEDPEPPVNKRQKKDDEVQAQAVDEHGNAIQIQSSSEQVSSSETPADSKKDDIEMADKEIDKKGKDKPVSISSSNKSSPSKMTVSFTAKDGKNSKLGKKLKNLEGIRVGVANQKQAQTIEDGEDSTGDMCNDSTIASSI